NTWLCSGNTYTAISRLMLSAGMQQLRQFLPEFFPPEAPRAARAGAENIKARLAQCLFLQPVFDLVPKKQERAVLAGEGDDLWLVEQDFLANGMRFDGVGWQLVIVARAGFAQIRHADAEFQQLRVFLRLKQARR